jgi:hypothetical protein
MPHYVPVPAHEIESFLESKGFTRTVQYREVVYVRPHDKNPDVKVKVYTSIRVGAAQARSKGADSIKVCTVFDNGRKSFGLGKFPRVHRTGSSSAVLERTLERMRDAYKRGTEWIRGQAIRDAARAPDEDLAWKAAFAEKERADEQAGFASDPDFRELKYTGTI